MSVEELRAMNERVACDVLQVDGQIGLSSDKIVPFADFGFVAQDMPLMMFLFCVLSSI
jgi:hypothetical protein